MSDEACDLVLEEARLLDERRFTEWLGLFAADATYWVPAQPNQRSPHEALSLVYETRELLAMRVERLQRPDMHVQAPASRTVHHVAGMRTRASQEERWELEVHSTLVLAEARLDQQRWFAARVLHGLRREKGALRIVLKRVDLVNADAPQRALAVPF
jgi:3-phenylpropionate/cinnamic acid dioxygenase small subunit